MKKSMLAVLMMAYALSAFAEEPKKDESEWYAKTAFSTAVVAGAAMLPNDGIAGAVKFGAYFGAGLENPFATAGVLGAMRVLNSDPIARSVALSLVNRGVALQYLSGASIGLVPATSFLVMTGANLAVGSLVYFTADGSLSHEVLKNINEAKWLACAANCVERAFGTEIGPSVSGLGMGVVALVARSEGPTETNALDESGLRLLPSTTDYYHQPTTVEGQVVQNAFAAAGTFWASNKLRSGWPKISKWMASGGVSFVISTVVGLQQVMLQRMNAGLTK